MAGPFPYTNNTPQSTDQISQTQVPIQQNFASIQTLIQQNHGDFTTAVAGQHNYVQMPAQSGAPGVTPGEVGLYNLLNAGVNEMFIRKSDGTSVPLAKASLNLPGYSYLPSGLIMQWGLSTSALPNPYTITGFPIAFTVPPFAIFVTPAVSSNTDPDSAFTVVVAGPNAPTINNFSVMVNRRSSSSGATQNTRQFYWLALGR